jgi:hypothetical protein
MNDTERGPLGKCRRCGVEFDDSKNLCCGVFTGGDEWEHAQGLCKDCCTHDDHQKGERLVNKMHDLRGTVEAAPTMLPALKVAPNILTAKVTTTTLLHSTRKCSENCIVANAVYAALQAAYPDRTFSVSVHSVDRCGLRWIAAVEVGLSYTHLVALPPWVVNNIYRFDDGDLTLEPFEFDFEFVL